MTFMLIVLGGSVACVLILTLVAYIYEVVENARFNRFKSIPEVKEKYKELDKAFDLFSAMYCVTVFISRQHRQCQQHHHT